VIVRRPAFVFESNFEADPRRFFRVLTTALMYSSGFYLDAAWLPLDFVRPLFADLKFSLPRLTQKEYIRLVARVPRRELFDDRAPRWLIGIPIWEWPVPVVSPGRRETKEGWLEFYERSWHSSDDAIPMLGGKEVDTKSVERMFTGVDRDSAQFEKQNDFFEGLGLIDVGVVKVDYSSTDKMLFWIELDQWLGLLKSGSLDKWLGNAGNVCLKRNNLCEQMRTDLRCFEDTSVFEKIQRNSVTIAEMWGLTPLQQNSNSRIGVSFQEAIGFLFSWGF
jgi:hypothetical protein